VARPGGESPRPAGAAPLFSAGADLGALQEAEERGLRGYENILSDAGLPPECRDLIRTTLLPQTRQHLLTLNQMPR